MSHPDATAARIARTQLGLILRSQALGAGFTPRMVQSRLQSGEWAVVFARVYRLTAVEPSLSQMALAACLSTGGVASHLTAGALYDLRGLPDPGAVEVSVHGQRRVRVDGVVVHRPVCLVDSDVRRLRGVPVTTAERTLADLAGRLEREALEIAVNDAVARGLVPIRRVRRRARLEGRGRTGIENLRAIAESWTADRGLTTRMERRLGEIIAAAGMDAPVFQYEVRERGRLLGRVDAAFRAERIFLEADDYATHAGPRDLDRHLRRQNALATRGWMPVRYSPADLDERPEEIAADIARARALRRLGRG